MATPIPQNTAPFSLDDLDDLFFFDVLVLDLADDLLDDVLERNESGHAAVFVDHDGDLDVVGLHALEQGGRGLGHRNEKGLAEKGRDLLLFLSFTSAGSAAKAWAQLAQDSLPRPGWLLAASSSWAIST